MNIYGEFVGRLFAKTRPDQALLDRALEIYKTKTEYKAYLFNSGVLGGWHREQNLLVILTHKGTEDTIIPQLIKEIERGTKLIFEGKFQFGPITYDYENRAPKTKKQVAEAILWGLYRNTFGEESGLCMYVADLNVKAGNDTIVYVSETEYGIEIQDAHGHDLSTGITESEFLKIACELRKLYTGEPKYKLSQAKAEKKLWERFETQEFKDKIYERCAELFMAEVNNLEKEFIVRKNDDEEDAVWYDDIREEYLDTINSLLIRFCNPNM